MKLFRNILFGVICSLGFVACDDNLNTENYYTFTGEMMSDYITSRPQYSSFATVVERAGLMDLLSTYGHYTCFLPDNEAFEAYLEAHDKVSLESLTDADCDTIARTHLVGNMYSTVEMIDGTLHTAIMNRRYIQITHGLDADSNSVVILNRAAHIYFGLEDDSVENGIVHPINMVLENSNASIVEILKKNDKVKTFYEALRLTGIDDTLQLMKDPNYNYLDYPRYYYKSDTHKEVATVPDEKKRGFTLFITPDAVLDSLMVNKYGIQETGIEGLKALAKQIYDKTYPEDKNAYAEDDYENPKHPLNRYVRYCILNRDVKGWDYLTIKEFIVDGTVQALGIRTEIQNPIDWYQTLLEGTMIKFEQLTVRKFQGNGKLGQRYANRRHEGVGSGYEIEGSFISPTVEEEYIQDAPNGRYFYVDDIVAFTEDVRDIVQNMRIRMDFSTIFPEIMTHDVRLNGDPFTNDNDAVADDAFKNGRNYYFPEGYLDGVRKFGPNCKFVYRRPHITYYVFCGDEMNLFGDYDFEFRLPPVPFAGDWQIRLGYSVTSTRGIAQIYFNSKPQGIPLDMTRALSHETIMGSEFGEVDYDEMTAEEKAEDQKALKNKGYYRGPAGAYYGTGRSEFETQANTPRRILCQVSIQDPTEDNWLRIRCASKSKTGNNNEFMLDYIELVPKSVYGVTDDGKIEDDL